MIKRQVSPLHSRAPLYSTEAGFHWHQRAQKSLEGEVRVVSSQIVKFDSAIPANKPLDHPNKNFGLSSHEFEELLKQLQKGNTSLFEQIFITHFDECVRYLQRKYNAQYDDAYDVSMDTLLIFRQRLVQGKVKYGNLRFLFTQMAGQQYVRNSKRNTSKSTQDLVSADHPLDSGEIEILHRAWKLLDEPCQRLLKMNFYGQMPLAEIAEMMDKKPATIRKQKSRCIEKLMISFKALVSKNK